MDAVDNPPVHTTAAAAAAAAAAPDDENDASACLDALFAVRTTAPGDDGDSTAGNEGVPVEVEAVSSVIDAKLVSEYEELHRDKKLYGGLPKDMWSARKAQENEWFSPQRRVVELVSAPLRNPDACMIVGINGNAAIALSCTDTAAPDTLTAAAANDDAVVSDALIARAKLRRSRHWKCHAQALSEKPTNTAMEKWRASQLELLAYAERNALFSFKMEQSIYEYTAYKLYLKYFVDCRIKTQRDAEHMIEWMSAAGKTDPILRPAIRSAGQPLSHLRQALPESVSKHETAVGTTNREHGPPEIHFGMYQFVPLTPEDMAWNSAEAHPPVADGDTVPRYTLLTCPVPSMCDPLTRKQRREDKKAAKKAAKKKKNGSQPQPEPEPPKPAALEEGAKERKHGTWKPSEKGDATFVCLDDAVPAVAFNNTHVAVLYQPKNHAKDDPRHRNWPRHIMFVDLFSMTHKGQLSERLDRFALVFPNEFAGHGSVNVSLSDQGIFCVAFSVGVIVFDVFRAIQAPRVFVARMPTPEGAEAPPPRVNISCATVVHTQGVAPRDPSLPDNALDEYIFGDNASVDDAGAAEKNNAPPPVPAWSGTLNLGTTRGEWFALCWRTGRVLSMFMTPGIEPILSMAYDNYRMLLHTVAACTVISMPDPELREDQSIAPPVELGMDRPICAQMCGTLIFVASKYGTVQLYSTVARNITSVFKPPAGGAETPLLQYHYEGIHVEPTSVTVVYPTGRIRRIVLQMPPPEERPFSKPEGKKAGSKERASE